MLLKIGIYDDEPVHRQLLKDLLIKYSIQRNVELQLEIFNSVDHLLNSETDYDLLFLDIMLEKNISGIDTGGKLREKGYNGLLILVTSAKQFALYGYEIDTFRYLLKPLTSEYVNQTMDAVRTKLDLDHQRIQVVTNNSYCYVNVKDIMYIESYGRIRWINTPYQVISSRQSLSALYEQLPHSQFFYSHKSILVNINCVVQIKGSKLLMSNQKDVPLSRAKYGEIMTAMQEKFGNKW